MSGDGADDVLRTCIEQLQRPVVDVQTLLSALCPPLEALGVLPTKFAQYVDVRVRPASRVTARHITRIQSAILEHVLPAWETELEKQHLGAVLGLWLCPVRSEKGPGAGTIAVEAYASLLSLPITTQSLPWITRLVDAYPIEAVHSIIFDHVTTDISKAQLRWEDAVRVITSVPAKAANALGTLKLDLPPPLKYGRYMNRLFIGVEQLIHEHCRRRSKGKPSIHVRL
jgi:telomere length regulation protein